MEGVTRKQFISFIVPLALAMAVIVCFSIVIAKKRSELQLVLAKQQTLEKELALLKKRNLELHMLRDALVYDPVEVEKVAREQLGYGRPKERLYKTLNFRIVDNGSRTGEKPAGTDDGMLEKLGLFGIFVVIIVGVMGIFYATYWYECRGYRWLRS